MNNVKQMIDLISGRGDGVNVATMGARDAGYYACSTFSECADYVRQYSDYILAEDVGGQAVPVLTDAEVSLVVLGLSTVKRVVSSLNDGGREKLEAFINKYAKFPEEWNLEAVERELLVRDWDYMDSACSVPFELYASQTSGGAVVAEYFYPDDFVFVEEVEHV